MDKGKYRTQVSLNQNDGTPSIFLLTAFSLFLLFLGYGYEITNYSFSIDEELYSFSNNYWLAWVRQGRWGMGGLVYFLPGGLSAIPFLPTFLFTLGLSFGAAFFSKLLFSNRGSQIVFCGIFVSSPIWPHVAQFNTVSWGIGIGLVVTAFSAFYLNRGGLFNALISALLMSFAISVYQSLLILYLILLSFLFIMDERRSNFEGKGYLKTNFYYFRDSFVSVFVSFFIYYIINLSIIKIIGKGVNYIDRHINYLTYFSNNFYSAINKVFLQMKGFLFGSSDIFLGYGHVSLLLFFIGTFIFARDFLFKKSSIGSKAHIAFFTFCIVLLSFSLSILSVGQIPSRALIYLPLLYSALSAFVFLRFEHKKILWVFFCLSLFVNVYISNSLFYADHIARERDNLMATRLIDRIEGLGRGVFGETIPLAIIGQWQHETSGPALRVEVFGASFFEHGGGRPLRVVNYLRYLGCSGLEVVQVSEIKEEMEKIGSRPSWPEEGSVFYNDSAIVVKLSDPTHWQLLSIEK